MRRVHTSCLDTRWGGAGGGRGHTGQAGEARRTSGHRRERARLPVGEVFFAWPAPLRAWGRPGRLPTPTGQRLIGVPALLVLTSGARATASVVPALRRVGDTGPLGIQRLTSSHHPFLVPAPSGATSAPKPKDRWVGDPVVLGPICSGPPIHVQGRRGLEFPRAPLSSLLRVCYLKADLTVSLRQCWLPGL